VEPWSLKGRDGLFPAAPGGSIIDVGSVRGLLGCVLEDIPGRSLGTYASMFSVLGDVSL
jgi:hypothetical protein